MSEAKMRSMPENLPLNNLITDKITSNITIMPKTGLGIIEKYFLTKFLKERIPCFALSIAMSLEVF